MGNNFSYNNQNRNEIKDDGKICNLDDQKNFRRQLRALLKRKCYKFLKIIRYKNKTNFFLTRNDRVFLFFSSIKKSTKISPTSYLQISKPISHLLLLLQKDLDNFNSKKFISAQKMITKIVNLAQIKT